MFVALFPAILGTFLLSAASVLAANATDWSSRSIYQVTRWRIQAHAHLTEPRSLSLTGLLRLMTLRRLATRAHASIAVARGRES